MQSRTVSGSPRLVSFESCLMPVVLNEELGLPDADVDAYLDLSAEDYDQDSMNCNMRLFIDEHSLLEIIEDEFDLILKGL